MYGVGELDDSYGVEMLFDAALVLAPFGALSLMAIVYRGERFEDYNVAKRTLGTPQKATRY